jgi:prolyl-tRNA synthetase
MLAAPRARITLRTLTSAAGKCQYTGQEFFRRPTSDFAGERPRSLGAMRMSELFLRTLRDDPADADTDSHRLLVRAGYIRRIAAGVYSWLPLGQRVLRRVEQIVREEMDRAGAQEVLLPIVQPLELWQRSGRDAAYGPLMFRLLDRKETPFCLSPTAEEVITTLVAGEYGSYRDLPVNLYQIHWKYRDELRPRFGLLRAREFLMKDAYSFDLDAAGLHESFAAMYEAYCRVFERCGLTFRAVEAESGEIGGDVSREFMAVAAVGEDDFVWCKNCDYAANVEAARRDHAGQHADAGADIPAMEEVHTPGLPGITGVSEFLGVAPSEMLKCIAFDTDGELGIALVPGDREVNEYALERAVAPRGVRLYTDDDFAAHPGLARGYIGPHVAGAAVVVADPAIEQPIGWVTGANRMDHHVRDAVLGRDFTVDVWAPLVTIVSGDACPKCGAPLRVDRGIEVGHVFQLGTKYSEILGARYVDEQGDDHPMVMGCYGIGVSRVLAAVVEEHHDEHGIAWPQSVAPFGVHLVALPGRGATANDVTDTAERIYRDLTDRGVPVLFDDRDVSPGVKFADADLLGVPVQVVVGAKGLAKGVVERKLRASGERAEIPVDDVVGALA